MDIIGTGHSIEQENGPLDVNGKRHEDGSVMLGEFTTAHWMV
jgi:hypothetical protein